MMTATIFAQQKEKDTLTTQELEEVVVSATRNLRQLSSVPLPAQLISREQIQNSGSLRLSDILEEQTGLITVPDFGGVEGIQIQGLDAAYTLILIDGVPLIGRSAGTLDLNRITVANIKQIEIVKGPSSSLFGSEAMGGVINIITEKPVSNTIKGELSYRYGTFDTHDVSSSVSYGKSKYGFSAYTNLYKSNGYDLTPGDIYNTVEPFQNITSGLQFRYRPSEKWNMNVSSRFFNQQIKAKSEVSEELLSGKGTTDEWNLHAIITQTPDEHWKMEYEFYTTRFKTEQKLYTTTNSLFERSYYNESVIRPEVRVHYNAGNKGTLTAGAGASFNTLDRTYFNDNVDFNAIYAYAQYDFRPIERLNVIAGARYDAHNIYESAFSPKLSAKYDISEAISIKGSAGFGFKVPDLRQLYFDFENSAVGYIVLGYNVAYDRLQELDKQGRLRNYTMDTEIYSKDLKTENSVGYNLGVTARYDKLKTEVNFFYNSIENLIDTRAVAQLKNGQNVFSYYNVGKVYTYGAEINATYQLTENLKLLTGYQLLFAKDRDVERQFDNEGYFARDAENKTFRLKKSDYFGLYNRSRHTANAKVFYIIPHWKASANLRAVYRSKFGLFDSNDNQILDTYDDFVDGYVQLHASFTKDIYKNVKVQFGIDNILDRTDTNISNLPGRIVYGRVQFQF
ncbi:TonB-dependent receptor [Sinomicrobium kalidii]|uniref:TonB-dependent receptor plug domain-containing protein n=1 Tax=Sinomicrobium kalidii TaxID=2900738 RepID=UPI001E3A01F2|nr:TonB-dependent receptor [Sinomicrobium kalidii]UGU14592.1 TonB-dependent receptor [Sinomicrobium kalidii]